MKIIGIDDNIDILENIGKLLTRRGHFFTPVTDPLEAIDFLKIEDFDIMLLDFKMKVFRNGNLVDYTGDRLLKEVRENKSILEYNKKIYVILMTAHANEAPPEKMLKELDIQMYIDKEIEVEHIATFIEAALKQKQIDKLNEKLVLQEKEKGDLYINLAHEIKTPITVIQNYLNEGLSKINEPDKCQSNLFVVNRNLENLKFIVTNSLTIEKIRQTGRHSFEHTGKVTNLSNLINKNVVYYNDDASIKKITLKLEIQPDIYVESDKEALSLLINNLVGNAIKYTPSSTIQHEGKITITLKSNDKQVNLTIEDNGVGIKQDDQTKIFDLFFQTKSSAGGGGGFGLYIVKQIADSLNAQLQLKSELTKGSQFKITFDRYFPKKEEVVEKTIQPNQNTNTSMIQSNSGIIKEYKDADLRPFRILLVEDNETLLSLMEKKFESENFIVHCANNGKVALEMIRKLDKIDSNRIDLIICDIMMPEMDGMEFYKQIHDNDKTKNLTLLFLTAKNNPGDILEGLGSGAVDYIVKPFEMPELILKARSIIINKMDNKTANKKEFSKEVRQQQKIDDKNMKSREEEATFEAEKKGERFGFTVGRAEGESQGVKKAEKRTIENLIRLGVSKEILFKATGLYRQEVEEIIKESEKK